VFLQGLGELQSADQMIVECGMSSLNIECGGLEERRCRHAYPNQISATAAATQAKPMKDVTSNGCVEANGIKPLPNRSAVNHTVRTTKTRSISVAERKRHAIRLIKV